MRDDPERRGVSEQRRPRRFYTAWGDVPPGERRRVDRRLVALGIGVLVLMVVVPLLVEQVGLERHSLPEVRAARCTAAPADTVREIVKISRPGTRLESPKLMREKAGRQEAVFVAARLAGDANATDNSRVGVWEIPATGPVRPLNVVAFEAVQDPKGFTINPPDVARQQTDALGCTR